MVELVDIEEYLMWKLHESGENHVSFSNELDSMSAEQVYAGQERQPGFEMSQHAAL